MKWHGSLCLAVSASLFLICCAGGATPEARDLTGMAEAGRLKPCPSSPNCISSQSEDPAKQMAPLPYRVDRATSQRLVLAIVRAMPRATLVVKEDHYLHVEFRSRVFSFVDDVEFLFDDGAALIHFRSASRTGYSDLGVNRKRMSAISEAYNAAAIDTAGPAEP